MSKIKFGIDGWWGVIAKDFTLSSVAKVASAIAVWLTNKFQVSSVVLGHDTRFGGEMFLEAIAKIIASKGIQVYLPESFVSTPMISLATVKLQASCGVIVTASHSPATYNGIKLKGAHGGPMLEKDIKDIENLISSDYEFDLEMINWNYLLEQGKIQYVNIESIYLKYIQDNIDIERLAKSKLKFAFDAMYGSTQNVIPKLLKDVKLFHCELNPSFNGVTPEPLHINLHELAKYIGEEKDIDCSLAVDSDGDRMALYDKEGNYISSHQILLLLIHYRCKYEGKKGKVVAGFSSTSKVEIIAEYYGLDVIRTRIGFNHIADIMMHEDILVGGEENGGMTIGTYLPERDGIWIGLLIWGWLEERGMSLGQLIKEVEDITGVFAFDRIDLMLNRNLRTKALDKCKMGEFKEFGGNEITKVEDLDGYKFHFGEGEWVLIRPSTIYPTLRLYAEAKDMAKVRELLQAVRISLENLT